MRTHLAPGVADLCVLLTTRSALEQPIDVLVRHLIEGGCIPVNTPTVMQAMLRSSRPCMRHVLSQPSAAALALPAGLLQWSFRRFAAWGDVERLECLVEFWRKCPHIHGLCDLAAGVLVRLPRQLSRAEPLLRRVATECAH